MGNLILRSIVICGVLALPMMAIICLVELISR